MGSFRKPLKRARDSESETGSEDEDRFENEVSSEEEVDASDDYSDKAENEGGEGESESEEGEEDEGAEDDDEDESEGEEVGDEEGEDEDEDDGKRNDGRKDYEMEELEKEYKDLQNMEQNLVQNLKRHKDEDLLKGQSIKSQKALWDKALEFKLSIQKAFSKSNKLPQEPIRSLFCDSNEGVSAAYSDVIMSSKKTIESLVQLQEALFKNNPSIVEAEEVKSQSAVKSSGVTDEMDVEKEKEWLQISQLQSRVAPFRNKAVDKWQRKADVQSGAAAKKAKLLAFNQSISDQVGTYMRDPSKMIRSMQLKREQVGVFGSAAQQVGNSSEEGDPELLDDSAFHQQLLKEFFETINPESAESAFYAYKRQQTKKKKVVDRQASKSRKIRYHVHEKIVNFMAPQPMDVPPMAAKLFENLFGLRTQKPTTAA